MKILKALLTGVLPLASASCDSGPDDYGYDATANPTAQWHQALAEARISGKRVLIIAGGSWCPYCRRLDSFLKENADVDTALHQAFIVLKLYYGDDNYNEALVADPAHQLVPCRRQPGQCRSGTACFFCLHLCLGHPVLAVHRSCLAR